MKIEMVHCCSGNSMARLLFLVLWAGCLVNIDATVDYSSLSPCISSSAQLRLITDADHSEFPCILYDIQPNETNFVNPANNLAVVTIIQVTPANCADHRDGAAVAVELMNSENNRKGHEIGFNGGYFVQFRLVSVVAGLDVGNGQYAARHEGLIRSMLSDTSGLNAQFVVGTCSFASSYEKQAVEDEQRILLAQVGPDSYYYGDLTYNFGIHLSSYQYAVTALRIAKTRATANNIPLSVAVFGRDFSEFFNTTCSSAVDYARENGIQLSINNTLGRITYTPTDAQNGTLMKQLAREVCESGAAYYIGCVNDEVQYYLDTWKEMGCNPKGVWLTCATWGFFQNNQDNPLIIGAAQWHIKFPYGDRFFTKGADLIDYAYQKFYYYPDYNVVASYTAAYIYGQHVINLFADVDNPSRTFVSNYFANQYEAQRRIFRRFGEDTIFGFVLFDSKLQRNVGREPAVSQWIFDESKTKFVDESITPIEIASAELVFPSFASSNCEPGKFFNTSSSNCFLCNKCDQCGVNQFSNKPNRDEQCFACPTDYSTDGLKGSAVCIQEVLDSIDDSTKTIARVALLVNYFLIFTCAYWLRKNRRTKVVVFSQLSFLHLILFGCFISTTSLLPLSFTGGDEFSPDGSKKLNIACMGPPWLFTIGWLLAFSALFTKTWRLSKVWNTEMKRVQITYKDLLKIICSMELVLVVLILIPWTLLDPLAFQKDEPKDVLINDSFLRRVTKQRCAPRVGDRYIFFFIAIAFMFFILLLVGNIILYRVRHVKSEFQERKWISFALFTQIELLFLGIPVFLVAKDNNSASLILVMLIFLNDLGVLLFIFGPKIYSVIFGDGAEDAISYLHSGRVMSKSGDGIFEKQNTNSKHESESETTGVNVRKNNYSTDRKSKDISKRNMSLSVSL